MMPRKILAPLPNIEKAKYSIANREPQQFEDVNYFKDKMRNMDECLSQITQQIKQLRKAVVGQSQVNHQKHPSALLLDFHQERMEKRFQDVKFVIPRLNKDEQRQQAILNWFSQVCRTVFSVGFNLYETGILDINKVKAYCSENVLRNLLYFSQMNELKPQQISMINNFLEEDLLPYYCQKYPQSQETQTSSKFSSDLIQRDELESNDYDLVYKSKVDFSYQESGNYNSQIMKFLNFIIGLPNKVMSNNQDTGNHLNIQNKKQKPLNEMFFSQMESIFRMVENQNNTVNMHRYNPREPTLFQWTLDESSEKEKQEYQQKVKSYTNFQIGQKLSKDFEPFSDFQIQSGDLKLKNSQMMRVLSKWCEELQNCYDKNTILQKQTYYRMRGDSKRYLSTQNLKELVRLVSKQKQNVVQKMKEEIKINNHKCQSELMKDKIEKQLKKLSENDAIVGQFACFTYKNNASYLISYLNALIHGINLAMKQLMELFDLKSQEYVPELITFKIGDLMRSKCSSKENQIIALYKQIERRHRLPNSDIKIIRVKNRLNQGNKDILMNLLYKGQMVVEMQLAIKSEKSKFIECSYNFNHYLYELKRAKFGPIMEMCNIWVNKDLKSKYYLQKLEKLNKRIKSTNAQQRLKFEEKIQTCCTKNQKIIILPFRCSICKSFYSNSRQVQNNIECQKCGALTCQMCQLQISDQQRSKLFKRLDNKKTKQLENVEFLQKIQGIGGAILNLKSKKRKLLYFINVEHKNEFYLFEYNNKNNEVKLIEKFKFSVFSRSFLKQNLVLTSPQIKKQIKIDSNKAQEAINKYFIGSYLKVAYKTEKKSLAVKGQNLKEETLNVQNIDCWPDVKSINFCQNKKVNLKQVVQKFPNVEVAILNEMNVKQFPDRFWKQLKVIQISQSSLKNFESLQECEKITWISASHQTLTLPDTTAFKNLKYLQLMNTSLKKIPENFCNLPSLEQLHLQSNNLSQIPQSLGELTKLQKLNINSNRLIKLPESIGNLTKLEVLSIQQNKIAQFPSSFGKLVALRQVNVKDNAIQFLPDYFRGLSNLRILSIQKNKIAEIPEWFGSLVEFEVLVADNNKITKLPESIGNLLKLRQANLSYNCLENLPQSFGNLQLLTILSLESNEIEKLPQSFGNLHALEDLRLSYNNNLYELPQSFGNLENLQLLKLFPTKIKMLPQKFGDLQSLRQMDLSQSQLQILPLSFANLKSLKIVNLSSNKFTKIPQQICCLQNLEVLRFNKNKITEIPGTFLGHQKLTQIYLSILNNLVIDQGLFTNTKSSIKIYLNYTLQFLHITKKIDELAKNHKIQVFSSLLQ